VFPSRKIMKLLSLARCHSQTNGRAYTAGFQTLLSLLLGMRYSERPGAVKGAPIGAAQRTLDGEDRSETNRGRGKGVGAGSSRF
jgi:hypothetical protein